MGAVINMLPQSGGGIKGSTMFKWMIEGVVDASQAFGGMVGNVETNGRNNLSSISSDGYLRIYNTSGGNGRSMISTNNYLPKGTYDYVLFHIVSLTTTTANQPLTFGGKTSKDATAPSTGAYSLGSLSLSDKWVAAPLAAFNAASGNHYFAFGGTVDCTIDQIYFVKVKS